jgi:hypothetical protein
VVVLLGEPLHSPGGLGLTWEVLPTGSACLPYWFVDHLEGGGAAREIVPCLRRGARVIGIVDR